MKIEGDYAIIETAEEAAALGNAFLLRCMQAEAFGNKENATRSQVLEVLTPKKHEKGKNHEPVFYTGDMSHDQDDDESPYYCSGCPRRCGHGAIKASALTTGKTVGELRDLLAWAKS
jgi:hypothetical protein